MILALHSFDTVLLSRQLWILQLHFSVPALKHMKSCNYGNFLVTSCLTMPLETAVTEKKGASAVTFTGIKCLTTQCIVRKRKLDSFIWVFRCCLSSSELREPVICIPAWELMWPNITVFRSAPESLFWRFSPQHLVPVHQSFPSAGVQATRSLTSPFTGPQSVLFVCTQDLSMGVLAVERGNSWRELDPWWRMSSGTVPSVLQLLLIYKKLLGFTMCNCGLWVCVSLMS